MKLLLTLLIAAALAFAGIGYILSLTTMQTVITTTHSLIEAQALADKCKGAHKVTQTSDKHGWVVKCRD